MPVNTVPGTPGYDPAAHYGQISANFPKPQPLGTHVSPPSTGTYPDPHDVASFAANRRSIDRRLGTGMSRRVGDVANPGTLFGEPGTGRSVDFRGAGRFNQALNPPHVAPVVDAASPLPGSREDLDAMLAQMGLGPSPEPAARPMPPEPTVRPATPVASGNALVEGYNLPAPRPAAPARPPSRVLGALKPMAAGAGLGLMFDTVNNPQGMADMVRNPGAVGRQMFEGFGAGANRLAAGQVGAGDLVTAVGNSLGMGSAFNAGTRMGNTMYQGITDPRRFGTNFMNGLGVMGKGMGF